MRVISHRRADIAIIGHGVAGCAAALSLQGTRRSVVIVAPPDSAGGGGIGETLSPAGSELLSDLGVAQPFAEGPHRPAIATYSAWEIPFLSRSHVIRHAGELGHVIDRAAFERMLRNSVARAPITRVSTRVVDAVRQEDGWVLHLSDSSAWAARFVLDCSGRAAALGGRFSRRRRADRLVAACSVADRIDDDVDPTPATVLEATADGWWYAALLPDRRIGLSFFSDPDLLPRLLSRNVATWRALARDTLYVHRWIASAGCVLAAAPCLRSAGSTWLEPAGGLAWAAAGDAAAAFDPLSAQGLTTALWTGKQAALAASAALDGNPQPLLDYVTVIHEAVRNFLVQRHAIYARVLRFDERPFWWRRGFS